MSLTPRIFNHVASYFVERKEKFAGMANQMNKDKSEEDHCQVHFSSLPVCQTSATHKSTTISYTKKKSNAV